MTVSDPAPNSPRDSEAARAAARRHLNTPAWNLLLLVPLLGTLIPPIYNKQDPKVFDIPFFYWYQMAWIAISVVMTIVVYRVKRGER